MKRHLLLLVAVVAFGTTACGPVTPYAAKVNGEVIPTSVVDEELHAITSNFRYAEALNKDLASLNGLRPGGPNTINSQYVASLLYDRILGVLIHEELVKKNLVVISDMRVRIENDLKTTGNDPTLFESLAKNYRDHIVEVKAELQTIMDKRSDATAQRAYYDKNAASFTQSCFRLLNIADASRATSIRDRLLAGGDFVALATEGAGPGAPAPSLEPICRLDSQLRDFERTTLAALKPNDVSQPLQSSPAQAGAPAGALLVQLVSRHQQTFEESAPVIRDQLNNPKSFFAELITNAKIKVNPRYGSFTPGDATKQQSPGITPNAPKVLADDNAATPESGSFQDGQIGGQPPAG